MLPNELCRRSVRIEGDRIVASYLGERDHRWLRALLEEHGRFVGEKRSLLRRRLREPLAVSAPRIKLMAASHVLDALSHDQTVAALPPREARWLTFRAAAGSGEPRDAVLARAAGLAGASVEQLEAALFADLKSERRVVALPEDLSPARLALETNVALVSALLRRAARVRIQVWDDARSLVRQARRSGLICTVTADDRSKAFVLDISGPFALFRHTQAYARALAGLVPHAASRARFEIRAECRLSRSREVHVFLVRDGDPVELGLEPALGESALERRFVRDFRGAAPDWELRVEPPPLEIDGALIFPDFELIHRLHPERRWLLETAGFWTPEYLEHKLERLRLAAFDRLLLCIDEKRACAEAPLPVHARVLRHRGRIDPQAVLAAINEPAG